MGVAGPAPSPASSGLSTCIPSFSPSPSVTPSPSKSGVRPGAWLPPATPTPRISASGGDLQLQEPRAQHARDSLPAPLPLATALPLRHQISGWQHLRHFHAHSHPLSVLNLHRHGHTNRSKVCRGNQCLAVCHGKEERRGGRGAVGFTRPIYSPNFTLLFGKGWRKASVKCKIVNFFV